MAGRGSALTRAVRYFKECDIEEAEVAFELVKRTLAARLEGERRNTSAPAKVRKPRTPKVNAQSASQAVKEGESLASA